MWSIETFTKEMKKFDPLLRIRLSILNPEYYLIERKCAHGSACLIIPKERRGIDNWVRDRDGYTDVMRVHRSMLNHRVFLELRAHDMWEYRSAGYYADMLEEQERQEEKRLDREQSETLQHCGEEAYDRAMVKQGDVVSNFRSKVGGYEPGSNEVDAGRHIDRWSRCQ